MTMLDEHIQVPAGQFGVVRSDLARCPWTGATPGGMSRTLVSLHGTREEADLTATLRDVDADFSPDVHHEVWPRALAGVEGE